MKVRCQTKSAMQCCQGIAPVMFYGYRYQCNSTIAGDQARDPEYTPASAHFYDHCGLS
jgi:hypothetical protein